MGIPVGCVASANFFEPTTGAVCQSIVLVLENDGREALVLSLPDGLATLLEQLRRGAQPAMPPSFRLPLANLQVGAEALTVEDTEVLHRWLVRYWGERYAVQKFEGPTSFIPGHTVIPPSGKVIGSAELVAMMDAVMDGWLTTGRFNDQFEKKLGEFVGVPRVLTTNSGSSANLLAFMALTSPKLGERAIRPGDEVITVAAGFPTTVNPIIQFGAVPVFVDIKLGVYNIDVEQIEAAIGPRTRAIMIAHTLGNPFDVIKVKQIAKKYGLWLVEDCCDALGATIEGQHVGTFGDLATLSFYPAHHITMGEGGAVLTHSAELASIVESLRDWGRDCYCKTGCDNTCGKRFAWQFGELPFGYDHKYVYTHAGYNLKITDMQAACGLAQLGRLPDFIRQRRMNFDYLHQAMQSLRDYFILPYATPGTEPSWFGYPLSLKPEANCNRVDLLSYLDEKRIGTRLLFGGNLLRQPYMQNVTHRTITPLINTDYVMNNTFWVGIYPALDFQRLDWTAKQLAAFVGVFD